MLTMTSIRLRPPVFVFQGAPGLLEVMFDCYLLVPSLAANETVDHPNKVGPLRSLYMELWGPYKWPNINW